MLKAFSPRVYNYASARQRMRRYSIDRYLERDSIIGPRAENVNVARNDDPHAPPLPGIFPKLCSGGSFLTRRGTNLLEATSSKGSHKSV